MSDKKQEIIGTPLAGLTYVFYSFCSFTDGAVTQEEVPALKKAVNMITFMLRYTDEARLHAHNDAITMLKGCPTSEDQFDLFDRVLIVLTAQEWWTRALCDVVLQQLGNLRDADGERHPNETYWIDELKETWKNFK